VLQSYGVTSFTYDGNGNTVSESGPRGPVTYTWDAEDRLVGVTRDGETETYAYRATCVPATT